MKQRNIMILASIVVLGIVLAAGLIVMSAIEKVQASNTISDARNEGQQGEATRTATATGGYYV